MQGVPPGGAGGGALTVTRAGPGAVKVLGV